MNDNAPEFSADLIRISVAENLSPGTIFYQVNAQDRDVGRNSEISYGLLKCRTALIVAEDVSYRHPGSYLPFNSPSLPRNRSTKSNVTTFQGNMLDGICAGLNSAGRPMFSIDSRLGHLTLSRPLDFEVAQRHTLLVSALDAGLQQRHSANLTLIIDVQDINDNPPQFERSEYNAKVLESMPINSQVNWFNYSVR